MELPTGELEAIRRLALDCLEAIPATTPADGAEGSGMLCEAFEQLLDVMQRVEADRQAAGAGATDAERITELGEYALQLRESLAARLGPSCDERQRLALGALAVEFALWIAGHGGRIDTLEPVVDALAQIANSTMDPADLETLSGIMGRITDAVAPVIREDLEKINPGRPWRVLLLNRGIVATRSHNTQVMEAAFAELTRHLPEDAARFFTEGMEQMEALDYPPQVREVMQKYHRRWTVHRSLH